MSTKVDKINEKLPMAQTIPLGLQHVLAMYAGAVVVPLIVGGALGMTPQQLAYLVAADLFTCGIATLLQAIGIGKSIGIKLPVVLGCSFTAVGPMITIGHEAGPGAIYGAIISSGIFVLIFSYFFGKLLRFFPPVVTGSVVTIIGLSLIPVAINNLAGGVGAKDFGAPKNLALGVFVMLFIILINKFFKGFWQAISVLLGLIVGTIVASFMGMTHFEEVRRSGWLNVVTPFYFGMPKFTVAGIMTMCLVAIVSMIESTGVFFGLGKVCEKEIEEKDIVRGLRAEGLAQILGGLFNSFPYTTFSQNVGLVALTGIRSRFVVVASGIILMILGTIPKFAALATIIPPPVLGGAMIVMFGMVAVSGVKMLSQADLNNNKNMLIAASAIAVGLGTAVVPGLFAKMPELFRILFESGIVSGSFTAVILNIILNWQDVKAGKVIIAEADEHAI
jgi:xanthine permease